MARQAQELCLMSHGLNQDSHKAWESGKGVFKESIMNSLSFI